MVCREDLRTRPAIKKIRVNYKFCPLCLHQIAGAILFAKSLHAVSLTFQNLACYVL
ncbi:hypothetical protein Hanom_Chr16g01516551 [Helianthus anomalus]